VGYIGEALVLHLEGGEIKDTYDYDLIDRNGVKIDVKTKERKVVPRSNYNCTVADFNTKQKCDRYAFGILGVFLKKNFIKKQFLEKKESLIRILPPITLSSLRQIVIIFQRQNWSYNENLLEM